MTDFYGSAVNDPADQPPTFHDQAERHGKLRRIISEYEVTDETSGDRILLALVPSQAILSTAAVIFFGAAGGTVTIDVGGDTDAGLDADTLIAAGDVATAGSLPLLDAPAIGDYNTRVWELLGYAEDPDMYVPIYLSLSATPGSATMFVAEIIYAYD